MIRDPMNKFLLSALTEENPFISTSEVKNWLVRRNTEVYVDVQQVEFSKLENWGFDKDCSKLVHNSGRFFSIEGINVKANWREFKEWDQPIINQPEIGYLAIITKEINGIL